MFWPRDPDLGQLRAEQLPEVRQGLFGMIRMDRDNGDGRKEVIADLTSLEQRLTQQANTRYLSSRSMARQVGQVRPEPAEERRGQR